MRLLDPRACKVFHFVVDFKRIYLAVARQSLGHANSTVATECAHFKDIPRSNHRDKHLE